MSIFDNDSIRTKLNSQQKMHSSQMVHFGTPLELVNKPLLSAYLLENSMLHSNERDTNFFKYVNLSGHS